MNLIQVQDALIATLLKCYRSAKRADGGYNTRKVALPMKVAQNKAERALERMGFTDMQAYRAVVDAIQMAQLIRDAA